MTLAPIRDDVPEVFRTPARNDTDSWINVVGSVVKLATEIAGTEFVPKGLRNSVPATAAAMLYGREVGLPPMTALTQIFVVDGRPGMYAEGMRALVLAAGHDLVFDEATGSMCRMRARRAGSNEWTSLSWSIDMARSAGLLGPKRENWHKYPRAMLVARCTADLCRMVFPDVIHGFRTVEELGDMGEGGGSLVDVAPTGNTTTVSRRRPRKTSPVVAASPSPTAAGEHAADDLPPLPVEDTQDAESGGEGAQTPTPPDEAPPPVAPPLGEGEVDDGPPDPRHAGRPQLRLMFGQFRRLGLDDANNADREERLALTSAIVGHEVKTANDLTVDEAQKVIVTVSGVRDADALRALLARIDNADDPLPIEDPPATRTDPPPPSGK